MKLHKHACLTLEAQPKKILASKKNTSRLEDYIGALKNSPNLNEDPVKIQRKWRNEWR